MKVGKYKNNIIRLAGLFGVMILIIVCLFDSSKAEAKKKEERKENLLKYHRIISLKPNVTQILISMGLGDKIVGITKFCPKNQTNAEVIGDYNSVNIEAVLRLKPDLIIGSTENSQKKQYDILSRNKLNLHVYDFHTYDHLKMSLTQMGELLGVSEKAEHIISSMDTKLTTLSQQINNGSAKSKTFVAIIQRRPLMVASGQTYVSTLLEELNMQNLFWANRIAYPMIDQEELIREFVDYTFDFSYDAEKEEMFLNKKIISLKIDDFVAAPQSVDNLVKVFSQS